jgi:hypothetical protein
MDGQISRGRLITASLLMLVSLLAVTLLLLMQAQLPRGMSFPLSGLPLLILLVAPGALGAWLLSTRLLVRLLVAGVYIPATLIILAIYSIGMGCYLGIDCL